MLATLLCEYYLLRLRNSFRFLVLAFPTRRWPISSFPFELESCGRQLSPTHGLLVGLSFELLCPIITDTASRSDRVRDQR